MKEWKETPEGWRTWERVPNAAKWLFRGGGLAARRASGATISLLPDEYAATADRIVRMHAAGVGRVVAGDPNAEWYRRALLALICIEDPPGTLPAVGDGGRSIGLYQFLRRTAQAIGYAWDTLARDADANHRAAFKLAKQYEPQHALDFVVLATLWNAGSVRPDPTNEWGVVLARKDRLTRYCRAYVAVGHALLGAGDVPKSSGGGGLLAAFLGWLVLS